MTKDRKELFRADAKQMVDVMFDNGLFKDDLTRDEMTALENWVNIVLSGRYESMLTFEKIMKGVKK